MENPYLVEPAKTGRSSCKLCKTPIAKDQLRFGTYLELMGHGSYAYRCLKCVTAKVASNVVTRVGSPESVSGYDTLSAADQTAFLAAFATAPDPKEAKAAAAAEAQKKAAEEKKVAAAKARAGKAKARGKAKAQAKAAAKARPKAKGKAAPVRK
mmetsp:Transcript_34260/g.74856  ORF Transcript_34260/g.74856 Transcript_34260/m.74856 type:complete len:154 (-) Transcript_34260:253-714(-)